MEIGKIRPFEPGDPIDKAVYCMSCRHLAQEAIGGKPGACFGHPIQDASNPMMCPYYENHIRVISILLFVKSGISIYHRTMTKDSNNIDPQMLSSFLQAINMFGEELAKDELTQIQFRKMNIVLYQGDYVNGALLVKGEIDKDAKDLFSDFVIKIESNFPKYFEQGTYNVCLPTEEVDDLAMACMKQYVAKKMYDIPSDVIEECCKLTCASLPKIN